MSAPDQVTDRPVHDVLGELPAARTALEASAGTGKTWTIAALVLRYVAEGVATLDQLLVVTFTRAATAELRDRVRTRLARAREHLGAVRLGADPGHEDRVLARLADVDADELRARVARLDAALAGFDAATITTIHGFCNQVLAAAGFAGDVGGAGRLLEDVDDLVRSATADLLVSHWAGRPADEQGDRPELATAGAVAAVVLQDPGAPVLPDPADEQEPGTGRALARLARDLRTVVDERKRARGAITFDDLLVRLHRSLGDDEAGDAIREAMRDRYRIALIDEFQDTDPVQWAILEDLFADRTVVLIGDPKQAIYRFRGADVNAYLRAVSDERTAQATLGTNHRSDARLVDAVNALFAGTSFGDPRIVHRHVDARHGQDRLRYPDGPREVLQVRALLGEVTADPARERIAADLAAEVTRLLASGARVPDEHGRERPLRPGDCAVLVRTNAQAEDVKEALARADVHAVVNGVGSVLGSPAAADWRMLLEALERPSSGSRVRALAISPLVGARPSEVAAADDAAEAELHARAHRWARVVDEHGIATLLRTIHRETALAARMLGQEGGERYLTDVGHVAELLHGFSSTEHAGPTALLSWLADQADSDEELPPEQRARRLESDARAVQVLTIHRSKGLQFAVVLAPYVMSKGSPASVPYRYEDPDRGRSAVDVGSSAAADAKARVEHETAGELLRLLYVALTRAEHRLVVWWWPLNHGSRWYRDSPLSKLLFCEGGTPRVTAERRAPPFDLAGDELAGALDAAVHRLGADADWQPVPDTPRSVRWQPDGDAPTTPVARTFSGRVDRAWQRASYTALTRPRPRPLVAGAPDAAPTVEDEDDTDVTALPDADELAGHRPLPLGRQPAGAAFGVAVHAVLEHVDLAADPLEPAMGVAVANELRRSPLAVDDADGLAAGLVAAARTPLGPAFGDATLAGTSRADRLDELEFELPLAHGDGTVTLGAIADLLRVHLPTDDPFVGYADALEDRTLARRVRGYLTGSIDLVLRRRTADGERFHVVDHKSNRLYAVDDEPSTWHYRRDALVEAMVHGHYPLQALLYQVALHRFLRWRMGGRYLPGQHLGAIGYTFLRGMIGPDAPVDGAIRCGVMAWSPPAGLVHDVSELLEVGR